MVRCSNDNELNIDLLNGPSNGQKMIYKICLIDLTRKNNEQANA